MILQQLNKRKIWITILIVFHVLIVAIIVVMLVPKRHKSFVPYPILTCPVIVSWNGLIPGTSTRQDVVDVLGKPDDKGKIKFSDGNAIPYYAYNVEGGDIAKYVQHRIFFRSDGKIDWIEVIVADSDGTLHTIQETVDQLGSTADTVYFNNNLDWFAEWQYDFQSGPDQVLVWSECGTALIFIDDPLVTEELSGPKSQVLSLRHPNDFASAKSVVDLRGIVLMRFLFQPTTYESYFENYVYRVPYGLWFNYLKTDWR